MRHRIFTLLLGLAVLVTAGCGFHLRGTTQVPKELQTLQLNSGDPYGPLARAVRQQLRLNDVRIAEQASASLPILKLLGSSENNVTVSVFQDGKAAERQLVLDVDAQVLMPNGNIYPLEVRVERSFFDNPLEALAKDAENELVKQEMREQAARQLIRKLLTIQSSEQPKSAETQKQ
ncbi:MULTISPECIES: LPS assembly lipoprotein LptE [Xenorhabdus]|uniref:LPS-assembly lipoprotein LptE n=1 Tax=Xenorhabdus stockiae TaxID=351614 RepID=A0A2D0KR36_9GAMM|nr:MULTISPECIES: LPS assembly lipoprotein LptE [Xenorhabdus]MCC8366772.1 LPS assembly lipoprotein LptE [Xenorhabdus sp. PB61.4]MCC8378202.1 LPS assembly lipoprotein LptE [Xenorhabdus sp. PB30.3]PHM55789.1 LPS assembly lipoprotein LptE [Xenorhabdus sp. KK7.4]PHM65890.1 LPS assembly lipoprotein LptE [Xenorhabdus stockiae]PHM68493.1 LPS assembly lipoprotein LptE [Xenorhabdus sp. KJ12.1]